MSQEMIRTTDRAVQDIITAGQKKIQKERTRQDEFRENWRKARQAGFGFEEGINPPSVLDYEEGRLITDVIKDGAWKEKRCFIIGGGDSLKGFDFSKLKNERIIGVNRAFEAVDCAINYASDHELYEWITDGKLGEGSKERFKEFKGIPVWLDSIGYDYPDGVYIVKQAPYGKMSASLNRGIRSGTNSGFGALGLAVCLGANPIYLLGFDMHSNGKEQSWWHTGYPINQPSKVYNSFKNDFNSVAKEIADKKIKVVNLNSSSGLKCFEFGKLENIKFPSRPIITSYYTKDTEYENQVQYLKETLRRFNLENDIVGIKDQGDWHKNTYYKPKFILSMMLKHKDRPIVFVDADAKMRDYPTLFDNFDCDFACHFRLGKELLSGTLYFGNTKKSRWFVRRWIEEDRTHPKTHMPQMNLRKIFDRHKNNIKWKELPVEYCMIFDSSARRRINPVVEHFQLSRKHKPKKRQPIMRRSIRSIQDYCEGKKIVLMGNADTVLKKEKKIDSFDVVCRMNRGNPHGKEKFIGSRTDILFLSTGLTGKWILSAYGKPNYILWMTECKRLLNSQVRKTAIQNPIQDWRELRETLGVNPSTGLMALSFLVKHVKFKSLTIYGFNFLKTKSWYNSMPDPGGHDGEKEEKMILEMISKLKNVKLVTE